MTRPCRNAGHPRGADRTALYTAHASRGGRWDVCAVCCAQMLLSLARNDQLHGRYLLDLTER